ncbi:MAG: hypothetical protein GXP29_01510, partial [Planctomycetes bacterium]|nr:hypothetical protein [Planctomycetota bacterium]
MMYKPPYSAANANPNLMPSSTAVPGSRGYAPRIIALIATPSSSTGATKAKAQEIAVNET